MTGITERIMRAGTFRLDLIETTPVSIIADLRAACGLAADGTENPADGHIVITSNRVDDVVDNLAVALYRGRLVEQTGARSFAGLGLSSWLGTSETPSPIAAAGGVTHTGKTLAEWVAILATNGLTVGTVDEPGGTLTAFWQWSSNVEQLDHVCRAMGAEWRVNPDGTIDAGPVADLYPELPRVLFSDVVDAPSSPGHPDAVRAIPATLLAPSVTSKQRASTTRVAGTGVGGSIVEQSSSTATVAYDPDGAAADLTRLVDASQVGSTEAAALATTVQALWEDPRSDFAVAVRGDRWRRFVNPGELALVWWPLAGIVDLSSPPFEFDGVTVAPRTVRIQQVDWGVSDGDGVYLIRQTDPAGPDTIVDLSEWVAVDGSVDKITVGAGNGAAELNESTTGAPRFATSKAVADRAAF